jgi:predicted ATPase
MRLKKIWVGHYKHLNDICIQFHNRENQYGSLRLFIGENGSGKSAMIEAIGLIFTRIIQDESPGFPFEVIYEIWEHGCWTEVKVRTNDSGKKISVWGNEKEFDLDEMPFSERGYLHPRRIIAQSSGPTSLLDEILIESPIDALKSDIFDIRNAGESAEDYNQNFAEIQRNIQKLKRINEHAPFLYINGETAVFVLITLCSIIPKENRQEFIEMRRILFEILDRFEPISFSLTVDDKRVIDLIKQYNELESVQREFLQIVIDEEEANDIGLKSLKKISRKQLFKKQLIKGMFFEDEEKYNRVTTYMFEGFPDFNNKDIGEHSSPLAMLAALLYAKNEGILRGAHLAFKLKGNDTLLSEQALSDGEYLWLARLGLVLLSRYEKNILFLYDEPDVHHNELWNIKFIQLLNMFTKRADQQCNHDYIIATHSSLILTDVTSDQLYHFIKDKTGHVNISEYDISPFAANRTEISKQIFGLESSVGNYTMDLIEKVKENKDPEEIQDLIDKMGPGSLRLQLRDFLYQLSEKR